MKFFTLIFLMMWLNAPSATREEKSFPFKIRTIEVHATVFYPTADQTDDTPFLTACGDIIPRKGYGKLRWCAVSRDLFKHFPCGSKIYIENAGKYSGVWTVKDKTNGRFKKRVDFLVEDNDLISMKCTLRAF